MPVRVEEIVALRQQFRKRASLIKILQVGIYEAEVFDRNSGCVKQSCVEVRNGSMARLAVSWIAKKSPICFQAATEITNNHKRPFLLCSLCL